MKNPHMSAPILIVNKFDKKIKTNLIRNSFYITIGKPKMLYSNKLIIDILICFQVPSLSPDLDDNFKRIFNK